MIRLPLAIEIADLAKEADQAAKRLEVDEPQNDCVGRIPKRATKLEIAEAFRDARDVFPTKLRDRTSSSGTVGLPDVSPRGPEHWP
jgi:hypothetical protein